MADLIEYRTYTTTPAGVFAATTRLTDGSYGDTTTDASGNPSGDITANFGAAGVTIFVEGRYTLDSLKTVTQIESVGVTDRGGSPSPATAAYAIYWGDASETYTLLQSGGMSLDTSTQAVWNGSQAGVKFVKTILSMTRTGIGAPQMVLSETDMRVTYTGGCTPPNAPTLFATGSIVGAGAGGFGGVPHILLTGN